MNNNDIIHLKKSEFDDIIEEIDQYNGKYNQGYTTHLFTCTTCHITYIDGAVDRCQQCNPLTETSVTQEIPKGEPPKIINLDKT
jgi:hypothetical protein